MSHTAAAALVLAGAAAAIYGTLKDHRMKDIFDVLEDWLPRAA